MTLISFIILRLTERKIIQHRTDRGCLILKVIKKSIMDDLFISERNIFDHIRHNVSLNNKIKELLAAGGFQAAVFTDIKGNFIYAVHLKSGSFAKRYPEKQTFFSPHTNHYVTRLYGKTWGMVWPVAKMVTVSAPLFYKKELYGTLTVACDLTPVFQSLRSSQKPVLIYLVFNTFIFSIMGTYLLSKKLVSPIHRLLSASEKFNDQGLLSGFFFSSSTNELGQLFRSLNMMFRRLEENRKDMKKQISSLQQANHKLKLAQHELVRAEKLASVGRLSAGVAHEIGNPLTVIMGYLELLKMDGLTEEEHHDFLERINHEMMRIKHTIKQLADLTRPSPNEKSLVNVHELLKNTVEIFKPRLSKQKIKLEFALNADQYIVYSDLNRLRQVFVNIIMNAIDAIGENSQKISETYVGTFSIVTCNLLDRIEIIFRDTGTGISNEKLEHIFEPFYTTKAEGRGAGLGLWVCYRLIKDLGGSIDVESPDSKGAVVTVGLHICNQEDKDIYRIGEEAHG